MQIGFKKLQSISLQVLKTARAAISLGTPLCGYAAAAADVYNMDLLPPRGVFGAQGQSRNLYLYHCGHLNGQFNTAGF